VENSYYSSIADNNISISCTTRAVTKNENEMQKMTPSLLLSLVPPSYIVVPIRDLVNIHIPTTSISFIQLNLYPTINMEKDIVIAPTRGRTHQEIH